MRRIVLLFAGLSVLIALPGLTALPASAAPPQITDIPDDAYRHPDAPIIGQAPVKPGIAPLSNTTADILSVTYAKAAPLKPQDDGAYSVALRVKGTPHPTYNYVVGASFAGDCFLIATLIAGETRPALAYCGRGDEIRLVGQLAGSRVSIKGDTISATFSFRRLALPSELKGDSELANLYAGSCPRDGKSWVCNGNAVDLAFSDSGTFSI